MSNLPKINLSKLPAIQSIQLIIQTIEASGYESRLIGGAVRNLLLNKKVQDIDLATNMLPELVTVVLENIGIKVIPTGINYGTVTAIHNGCSFEITTLRKDISCDGRRAEVSYTNDWQQDAARRDFTINAMSSDLAGNVYDYFEGYQDLQQGKLKFVGDASQRVSEDHLRILRYFRFYAVYSTGLADQNAYIACKNNGLLLEQLSGERIYQEMFKLISASNYVYVLRIMIAAGILQVLLPIKVIDPYICSRLDFLNQLLNPSPILKLALLLRSNGVQNIEEIATRWRFSKHDKNELANLVNPKALISPELKLIEFKKLLFHFGTNYISDLTVLAFALDSRYYNQNNPYRVFMDVIKKWRQEPLPITGADLLKLGIVDRQIGLLLRRAEDLWVEYEFTLSREQLLAKLEH